MYTELIIRPKSKEDIIFYPDVARAVVAESLDGIDIPPLLFNRDIDGKALQGRTSFKGRDHIESNIGHPPAIFFDGGKGFIRIFGLGKPGRELLHNHCGAIAQAVGKQTGSPFSTDLKHGTCGISRKGTTLYSIRQLVIEKNPKKANKYIRVDPISVQEDIQTEIYRGLIAQAQWLDEHNEQGASNLERFIPDIGTLDVDIISGESTPIPIKNNILAAGFKQLVFSMNITLTGPWLCGHLKSRGYGHIRPYINQRSVT